MMMLNCEQSLGKRPLGRTGFHVSELALGTVELGMDYGLSVPGDYGKPTPGEAIYLLHRAADAGITLFDTAPGYGDSEALLGQALKKFQQCLFATKVPVPRDHTGNLLLGEGCKQHIEQSLLQSLQALRRDVLDIVQIHNATMEVLEQSDLFELLNQAKQRGLIRWIGASVYQEHEALAAIRSGICDVLQVPYNLLDQRMAERVFPAAAEAGVGIIVRSVFLKGVLTEKVNWLPSQLTPLKEAAEKMKSCFVLTWEGLASMALRFCLSHPSVATVLVGIRTVDELYHALDVDRSERLTEEQCRIAQSLQLHDESLLNPNLWPAL